MTNAEIYQEFFQLTSQLSPENLSCDGELSRRQIEQKRQRIKTRWTELEHELGRKVTEDAVYMGVI